jgi:guanosine-3',5'-bis(diphosphate) 3'-pyrophosphohydrolase
VIELPRGATALDFAYALHSKIGDGTIGVKIDGAIAKLDTPLHSGCSVEVLTSARQTPGKEWLDFVMTRRAKEKIRYALRQQQRQQFRTQGVEQIEKLFRQAGLNWNRLLKEGRLEQACQEQRNQSLEHLLIQVGEGSFRASDLVAWFTEAGEETRGEPSKALRVLPGEKCRVVVGGLMQVRTRFAKCCTPKPGDAIIGYLAQGHEVRIHHADCDSVTQLDSRRLVEVGWAPAKEGVTEVLAG